MILWENVITSWRVPSDLYFSAKENCTGDFFGSLMRAPEEYRAIALLVIVLEVYRLQPTDAHANLVRRVWRMDPTSVMDL